MKGTQWFLAVLILVVFTAFQRSGSYLMLEAKHIAVSKRTPFAINFELSDNEVLELELFKEDPKLELDELTVAFYNGTQLLRTYQADLNKQKLQAAAAGFYRIELTYPNRKDTYLSFNLYSNKKTEIPPGKEKILFNISSGFLGLPNKMPEAEATFTFNLKEGQLFQFSSGSPDAVYYNFKSNVSIKQHWVSDTEKFLVAGQTRINAHFFVDKPKDVDFFKFNEFFRSRKGLEIKNLQLVVATPAQPIDQLDGSIVQAGGQNNQLAGVLESIRREDSIRIEGIKKQQDELIKALTRDTAAERNVYPISCLPNEDEGRIPVPGSNPFLAPTLDLGNNGRRNCFPLSNIKLNSSYFWVYWIGAGPNAMKEYQDQKSTWQHTVGAGSPHIVYAKYLMEQQDFETKDEGQEFVFPSKLDENSISYAIVDKENRDLFLAGQHFTAMFRNDNIASDFGNGLVDPIAEYHLCVCNNNRVSPTEFVFIYETFKP